MISTKSKKYRQCEKNSSFSDDFELRDGELRGGTPS